MSAGAVSAAKTVTIYALTDPDSGEVRYVGQASDVLQRYRSHIHDAIGSAGKYAWLQGLRQQQKVPTLKILEENVSRAESRARERWWIDYYHRQGATLVNLGLRETRPRQRRTYLQQPHPLRQWRELTGKNQLDVARACGITQAMVSLIEIGLRVPQGDALEQLMAYTGLPLDAFVRTERFLEEQPDFLRKYRRKGRGGGRAPDA